MTQASPDHIREYVAEFRREFVTGARSDFTAAERKQLGLLPYLRNCACLGVTSSVYGAGYLFQPGTRDEFLDIGRPVYATLAQPSLTTVAKRYAITLAESGGGVVMIHSEVNNGTVLIDGGTFFMVRSILHDLEFPLEMRGPKAHFICVESAVGSGRARRHLPYASLLGDNSQDRWSPYLARVEAQAALSRARVEMLIDERSYAPLRHLSLRSVLLLGDFGPEGSDRLSTIRRELENAGYRPFRADEIEDIPKQDIRAKVLTLASVCRFVVMDDSSRAGQIAEVSLVEQAKTPTIIMRMRETFSSAMTRGGPAWGTTHEIEYTPKTLSERLLEGVTWAEEEIATAEQRNNTAYRSWRDKPSGAAVNPYHVPYGLSPFIRQSSI